MNQQMLIMAELKQMPVIFMRLVKNDGEQMKQGR